MVEGSDYERRWSLRRGVRYELLADRSGLWIRDEPGGGGCSAGSLTRISRSLLRNFGVRQTAGLAYYFVQVCWVGVGWGCLTRPATTRTLNWPGGGGLPTELPDAKFRQ